MNDIEKRKAAQAFADYWKGKGRERQDDRSYWTQLLEGIFGVQDATKYYEAAKPVTVMELDGKMHNREIDIYIPSAKVLIEQKGVNIDLSKKGHQSGGDMLTPFEQAKRYNDWLGKEAARWIICCNFAEFWVYDMYTPTEPPVVIKLEELPDKYHLMNFLLDANIKKIIVEQELSFKAGELVGQLYDLMLPLYKDPSAETTLQSLNKFCVRIVFCLYAEDALLFGGKGSEFHDYLVSFLPENRRKALISLFRILDQQEADRDPYEDKKLLDFPYVNGGLFAGDIEIPRLPEEVTKLILEDMSEQLDWSHISPTIFGAVFESTLNPDTRHKGGMHYTSIKDIHKVIDPLFLDDLQNEFNKIISDTKLSKPKRKAALENLHNRLAQVHFLDPACGSGNFLTETFLSLRRLENKIIEQLQRGMMVLEFANPVKVSIGQFAGIEINDFAVTVARTALWIAESQMIKETEAIVNQTIEFFPLKTDAKIVEGNALRMDWNDVVSKYALTYIMGNPPFVSNSGRGKKEESSAKAVLTEEQRKDREAIFGKAGGVLDYVACWFKKAADFMQGTKIKAAFVATDSICQGQQLAPLWKPLFKQGILINFAYTFFPWESEATNSATVFVVIIGFSYVNDYKCKLFTKDETLTVNRLNAYFIPAANDIFIEKRNKPLCNVSSMHRGSQPTDQGNFIFSEEEYNSFIAKNPDATFLFRPFYMGKDFIDRKPRYCLWLADIEPIKIKKYPEIVKRIQDIKEFRLKSTKAATRKKSETPMLFDENQQPDTDYIAIPVVSAGTRRYIPIDYLSKDIVAGNKLLLIENATLYEFGVITSNIHMSWMRVTCSYYGPSYQYSINIVYNCFPWPEPTEQQRQKIEQTAKAILDARANHPNSTFADLYNDTFMPEDLRKAHKANDKAVMEAYGMWGKVNSESECVAELFRMYQERTQGK